MWEEKKLLKLKEKLNIISEGGRTVGSGVVTNIN